MLVKGLCFLPECSCTISLPEGDGLLAGFRLESKDEFEEDDVEGGTIIAREPDQSGFDDKAAKLDQMTCAFAALHDSASHVSSCLLGFETTQRGCRWLECFPVGL